MQYSPKLKKAMEEIKDILSKHDIAGLVILHTAPGYTEFLNKLDPTYSCIKVTGDQIRFKAKLEDYNGDKEAWRKKTTESLNLLASITECGIHVLAPLSHFSDQLTKELQAEHTKGTFTSHNTQNN
ncbi:MAG: hypothetical protein EOP45_16440 [Sphingobacteriaceae bacterium]|nr:MAG: hypothetical protein EOP45_16440 [Sphingobacteriaceae bacterium]